MDQAEDVVGDVASHDWFKRLARFGMVARGVLYIVVALLALRIATGDFDERADKQGALQAVVRQPFGKVLVAILAVGFAGYALWRFVEAVLGPKDEKDRRKALFKRLGYAARGLLYTGFFATAVKLLVGADEGAEPGERRHRLDGPGARLAGRAAAGGGRRPRRRRRPALYIGWRGLRQKFAKKLKGYEMEPGERKWILRLGTVGNIARMIVFVLIGVLLVVGRGPGRPQRGGRHRRRPPPPGRPRLRARPAHRRRPRAGRLRALLLRRGPLPPAAHAMPA